MLPASWLRSKYYNTLKLLNLVAVWIICVLAVSRGFSQNQDSIRIYTMFSSAYGLVIEGAYNQADDLVDSILKYDETALLQQRDMAADVYNLSLVIKRYVGSRTEMYDLWKRATTNLARQEPVNTEGLARVYMAYAGSFNENLAIDSINYYLDPAEDLLKSVEEPAYSLVQFYYQKGRMAYNNFDFEAQVNYFLSGYEHLKEHFPDNYLTQLTYCNALGIGFRNLARYEEAVKYLKIGLDIPALNVPDKLMRASLFNNLGSVYQDQGRFRDCIEAVSASLRGYQAYPDNFVFEIGSGFNNLGRCYKGDGDLHQARIYFKKSLDFIKTNLDSNHRDLVLPYLSLGDLKLDNGDLDSAAILYEYAKQVLVQNGWSREEPSGDFIIEDPFDVLSAFMQLYRKTFEKSGDTTSLKQSFETMEEFMATTDYAFQKFNTTNSIENYFRRYANTYADALYCIQKAYEINQDNQAIRTAIDWIEKYKAIELRHAFRRAEVRFTDDYQNLYNTHRKLQDSIRYLESRVLSEGPKQDSFLTALTRAKVNLEGWFDQLRASHPEYYQLVYQLSAPNHAYEEILEEDQSIILLKLGRSELFSIIIRPDTLVMVRSPFPDTLRQAILQWRKATLEYGHEGQYDDNRAIAALAQSNEAARQLYEGLIRPIKHFLSERLVIIPDGPIGYLSFAALLEKDISDLRRIKDYPFLIHQYAIDYSVSIALYDEMRKRDHTTKKDLLTIAPYFDGNQKELPQLPYNEKEANDIHEIFNGEILLGNTATMDAFIERCPNFRMIHLATHGRANDQLGQRSFLVFAPDSSVAIRLYAGDVYNLNLQADLVGLSACETGIGELSRSEGMISLARAFSFAGAKSVLSSLWTVNDKSTSQVMQDFYRNLKSGAPKDRALQSASKAYLQTVNEAQAHPFYWSAFILIGDVSPVYTSQWFFWLLCIGLLLFGLIFYLVKKSR